MIPGRGSSKGFTLIELMIIVSIIGILLAIAIPRIQYYSHKDDSMRVIYKEDGTVVKRWKVPWKDIDIDLGDQDRTIKGDETVSFDHRGERIIIKAFLMLTQPWEDRDEEEEEDESPTKVSIYGGGPEAVIINGNVVQVYPIGN